VRFTGKTFFIFYSDRSEMAPGIF